MSAQNSDSTSAIFEKCGCPAPESPAPCLENVTAVPAGTERGATDHTPAMDPSRHWGWGSACAGLGLGQS